MPLPPGAYNIAGEQGLPISVTSQVFTLSYFVGLFGFPYVGGVVISSSGVNALLAVMVVIVLVNVGLVIPLLRQGGRAEAAAPEAT